MTYDEIYEKIYEAWQKTNDPRYDIALDILANIDYI